MKSTRPGAAFFRMKAKQAHWRQHMAPSHIRAADALGDAAREFFQRSKGK